MLGLNPCPDLPVTWRERRREGGGRGFHRPEEGLADEVGALKGNVVGVGADEANGSGGGDGRWSVPESAAACPRKGAVTQGCVWARRGSGRRRRGFGPARGRRTSVEGSGERRRCRGVGRLAEEELGWPENR